METTFRRQKRRNDVLPSLNAEIHTLRLAKDTATVKQAEDVFASAGAVLTTIRVGPVPIDVCWLSADERIEFGDQRSRFCGTGARFRWYLSRS